MKIAFIMLCHSNPDQINMLISRLLEFDESEVFIHVDMNHLDVRNGICRNNRVHLLSEQKSYFIKWGSVQIVKATLELIRMVRDSDNDFDYIWLLSGKDYPICSTDEIMKRLYEYPEMNYIDIIFSGNDRYDFYKKRCEIPYPSWINSTNVIVKVIKNIYMIITGGRYHTFSFLMRKKKFDLPFAFGSEWWVLTAECTYEILDYSDEHLEILKYYEKCIIPDESFFQTIFAHGNFKDKRKDSLTYVNWGNNHRSPEILTIDDKNKVIEKSGKFCFARKFEVPLSNDLINEIEKVKNR